MAWGALAGAAGSLIGDLIGGAPAWGLANKSNNRYKSAIRHLRRREYQDMVFSMKKAGLNPMLATGANPGHSAMSAVTASPSNAGSNAVASAGRAISAAKEYATTDPQVANIKANTEATLANADNQNWSRERDQAAFSYSLDQMKENIKNIRQDTKTKESQSIAALAGAGLSTASAKEAGQRIMKWQMENTGKADDPLLSDSWEGTILRHLNAWSGAIQGGAQAVGTARGVHDQLRAPDTHGGYETQSHYDASGAFKGKTHKVYERNR